MTPDDLRRAAELLEEARKLVEAGSDSTQDEVRDVANDLVAQIDKLRGPLEQVGEIVRRRTRP